MCPTVRQIPQFLGLMINAKCPILGKSSIIDDLLVHPGRAPASGYIWTGTAPLYRGFD